MSNRLTTAGSLALMISFILCYLLARCHMALSPRGHRLHRLDRGRLGCGDAARATTQWRGGTE